MASTDEANYGIERIRYKLDEKGYIAIFALDGPARNSLDKVFVYTNGNIFLILQTHRNGEFTLFLPVANSNDIQSAIDAIP